MLADGARSGQDGKLYIFGGQWDTVFAPTVPTMQKVAFAIVLEVGYNEALQSHSLEVVLVDEDGQDAGAKFAAQFLAGHPPLTEPGAPVMVALPVEPPPIPITNYQRYVWKILLDGEERGSLPMTVRQPVNMPLQQQPPQEPAA